MDGAMYKRAKKKRKCEKSHFRAVWKIPPVFPVQRERPLSRTFLKIILNFDDDTDDNYITTPMTMMMILMVTVVLVMMVMTITMMVVMTMMVMVTMFTCGLAGKLEGQPRSC